MPSMLELKSLYDESLVREIIEKSKTCALSWNHLGGTQFKAVYVDTASAPPVTWEFFITKTIIGSSTAKYNLDMKKNGASYITIEAGPLAHTGRESVVKELYEIVEILVLQLDTKIKEALQFVQNIEDCRSS